MTLKEILIVTGARRIGLMSDMLAAFLIIMSFIFGFWTGVDWYRRKIIQDGVDAQEARTE